MGNESGLSSSAYPPPWCLLHKQQSAAGNRTSRTPFPARHPIFLFQARKLGYAESAFDAPRSRKIG